MNSWPGRLAARPCCCASLLAAVLLFLAYPVTVPVETWARGVPSCGYCRFGFPDTGRLPPRPPQLCVPVYTVRHPTCSAWLLLSRLGSVLKNDPLVSSAWLRGGDAGIDRASRSGQGQSKPCLSPYLVDLPPLLWESGCGLGHSLLPRHCGDPVLVFVLLRLAGCRQITGSSSDLKST